MSAPLRLGILGCANIAKLFVRDVTASAASSGRSNRVVTVAAAASRDAAKAAAFAAQFGIPRQHGSYEALLADPDIDAVYIPLPNTMHAEWSIKAAAAGKHVLCEKPLAVSGAEARAMFDAAYAHGVLLLEAYPWWFQPQTGELVRLLKTGAIGEVRSVQASFGFSINPNAVNIRLDPTLGGGGLLDAGCYPLSLVRLAMGAAPQRVWAQANWGPSGVDIALMATLWFADGRRAQISCAMDGALHRTATIVGSAGAITSEFPNHTSTEPKGDAHGYLPAQLRLRRGVAGNIPFEQIQCGTGSGFRFAAEAFAKVVRERDTAAIERAAAASVDIADTLEAIATSARSGLVVAL